MSALTSLLVRDQVVQVRKIEEAIQRQVISGGDVEDILLDTGAVEENVMSAYRAALYGILPATREEVMTASREAVRLVPKEVAEQYRLVPLAAEARTLVVAVSRPLTVEADERLSFLLGHDLVYRIVNGVRLQAALAHHYGVPLTASARRIVEKLRGREPGNVPYVAPPKDGKVTPSAGGLPVKRVPVELGAVGPSDGRRDTAKFGRPPAVVTGAAASPGDHEPTAAAGAPEGSSSSPEVSPLAGSRPPSAGAPSEVGVAPASRAADAPPADAAAEPTAATHVQRGGPAQDRPTAREEHPLPVFRGPVSAKQAVSALAGAKHRDQALHVLFVFARQFFDYTALFVVHDEIAEGRDAYGSGPSREAVARIAVPLDIPGTFADVRDDLTPRVVDLTAAELDRIVCRDLHREEAQPGVLFPITVRGRAVLLLYGDQAGQSFGLSDVPELVALLPRVGETFQRIILERKLGGDAGPDAGHRSASRSVATRVAGLAEPVSVESPGAGFQEGADAGPSPEGSVERGRRVRRRKRSAPLDVLGVPRSAPPPPTEAALRHAALSEQDGPGPSARTRPDGSAAEAQEPLQALDEPGHEHPVLQGDRERPGPAGHQRVPGHTAPVDRPPATATLSAPRVDSSYSFLHPGSDSVEDARAREGTGAPPGPSPVPKRRPDERREDDGSAVAHDIVRLPATHPAPEIVERESLEELAATEERRAPTLPGGEIPSVIVDMGAAVEALVDDLVQCGPDDEMPAVSALLSVGEVALPVLVQRFPGTLWFDRRRPHRRLPRGRDISAIARAFVAFRERAIPYVASLLSVRDADVRFYAALLSSEFVSARLLDPLAQRIFDRDPGTRVLALDVLRHYQRYPKELEEMLKGVRVEARANRRDAGRRRVAARALGELRDGKSLPLLVELLGSEDRDLAVTAHHALIALTRQDFGEVPRRWMQWADRNGSRHRIEWLIDSLVQPDEGLRAAAADELKTITQEYFGYHPGSPRRDREISQKKYRRWWKGEGRRRFG